jgi:hypothetical protein
MLGKGAAISQTPIGGRNNLDRLVIDLDASADRRQVATLAATAKTR